jgi:DHA1 family multidrug resistance protein-like MFS transporter
METWRRNQHVMVATVFVVFTGFAFVLPFLPLYVRELGVRDDEDVALWSGVLIGVSPLLAGLLAPLWGRWADRHGQKRTVLRALLSYVVLLVLSALAADVLQLLALRVGIGLFGGIGPLGLAMATALAPREETGKAVGMVQSAQILSAAVGPFAGGLLADALGMRATFLVTAALCAASLVLVARFYVEAPRPAGDPGARAPFAEVLRIPRLLPLLAVLFLVNFIGRSFTPILPLHVQGLGVPAGRLAVATGILISAYSVAAAASSTLLGRASRDHSPVALLIASLLGGAATVLPMAWVSSFGTLLALAALLGLASGGSLTLCYTIGGLAVPAERRATAFGFFSGAALFGGAISPSVAGLLAHWDLRGIFYLDAALYAALTAGLLAARRGGALVTSRREPR